jgi:hypothetical protein
MMKASFWGGTALAILILSGAGAYAAEPVPPGKGADAEVTTPARKATENLIDKSEKLKKLVEKKKAADEEKRTKQEKQAKIDKIQHKTGRTPTSWQVLNR